MGPKPTITDIEALRTALSELQKLNTQMGSGTGGAYAKLDGHTDISDDLGPLISGSGMQISTYVNARTDAVRSALQTSGQGVDAAVTMLKDTIDAYDTHEKKTKETADSTATGGSGSSGSGGPNSNPGKA